MVGAFTGSPRETIDRVCERNGWGAKERGTFFEDWVAKNGWLGEAAIHFERIERSERERRGDDNKSWSVDHEMAIAAANLAVRALQGTCVKNAVAIVQVCKGSDPVLIGIISVHNASEYLKAWPDDEFTLYAHAGTDAPRVPHRRSAVSGWLSGYSRELLKSQQ